MLGISTCWWHGTSLKGDEIIRDALGMGFAGVERKALVAGRDVIIESL